MNTADFSRLSDHRLRAAAKDLERADDVALRLLLGGGVLQFHESGNVLDAVTEMEGCDIASHAMGRIEKAAAGLSIKALDAIGDVVNELAQDRLESAYMLGVAVGRRLGPQPFTAKGGAR